VRALTAVLIVAAAFLALPAGALASVDLEVSFTQTGNPQPEEGEQLFQATVTNHGPDPANTVSLVITAPTALYDFLSFQAPGGSAMQSGGTVTFSYGTIANGASVTGKAFWTSSHPGSGTATADVDSVGTESSDANNHATLPTTIVGLTASGGALGEQALGTVGPVLPLTITNHSINPATVSFGGTATGDIADFALGGRCPTPLAEGESCPMGFRFLPSALGARVAHVTIVGSGDVDDIVGDITGTGIPFPTLSGPQGPPGPRGPAAFKLVVAPVNAKLRAKAGKKVTFSYVSTLDATATLDVLKGSKRVARVRGSARTGTNKLRWNGKVGGKAASAGKYKLRLTAVNGTQKATANAKLTLTGG
jgi:hypothetical protein